jgi:hypothetical protein
MTSERATAKTNDGIPTTINRLAENFCSSSSSGIEYPINSVHALFRKWTDKIKDFSMKVK